MDDSLHSHLTILEDELSKLKAAVDYIESAKISVEASEKIINGAKNLQVKVEHHAVLIEDLIKKIDKVDFPSRLDKIDTVIVTINQSIANLQARIDSVESSIIRETNNQKKEISDEMELVTMGMNNINKIMEANFEKSNIQSNEQYKKLKMENKILFILLAVLIIAMTTIFFI